MRGFQVREGKDIQVKSTKRSEVHIRLQKVLEIRQLKFNADSFNRSLDVRVTRHQRIHLSDVDAYAYDSGSSVPRRRRTLHVRNVVTSTRFRVYSQALSHRVAMYKTKCAHSEPKRCNLVLRMQKNVRA